MGDLIDALSTSFCRDRRHLAVLRTFLKKAGAYYLLKKVSPMPEIKGNGRIKLRREKSYTLKIHL